MLLLAGAGASIVGFYYLVDPASTTVALPCLFHRVTGWYCPGCGGQRALHALLHGRIQAALSYNALAVVLGVVAITWWTFSAVWKPDLPVSGKRQKTLAIWWWLLGGTLLLFGVCRNLPWPPFRILAP